MAAAPPWHVPHSSKSYLRQRSCSFPLPLPLEPPASTPRRSLVAVVSLLCDIAAFLESFTIHHIRIIIKVLPKFY